jgi:glycosyltransferase involved in cell wall biosynthesis
MVSNFENHTTKAGKQILFVNQSSGYLMIDIVNAFRGKYDERILATGSLNPRSQALDIDVIVERMIRYDRSTGFRRISTWVIAFFKVLWLILFRYRKAHVFIVSNPPLNIFLPLIIRNSYDILIYDIYPDAIIGHGLAGKDSWLVRFWTRTNKKVMSKARRVYTITESMKKVISTYVPSEKIDVVQLWTDSTYLQPVERKENQFIKKHGLENKFLIIYSGNLGRSHSIEVMLKIAEEVRKEDVFFLIIGEGDKQKMLMEGIASRKLGNCMLLPWQETSMLPHSLSAADLAVVTLGKDLGQYSVPSKLYSLMSVGAPVMGIAEKETELSRLLDAYQIGICFEEDDLAGMVDYINRLVNEYQYRDKLRQNALAASRDFTSANAMKFV